MSTVSTVFSRQWFGKEALYRAKADTLTLGFSDAPADKQSLGTSTAGDTSRAAAGDTSGAAQKGTAETRGADEQVGDGA